MIHLKQCVERVVRPLVASERRKDRIREELYQHLQMIHEEELLGSDDEDEAARRAVRRFGEPAEIRDQLRELIPWTERALYVDIPILSCIERWGDRKLDESSLSHATRITGRALVAVGALILLLVPTLGALRGFHSPPMRMIGYCGRLLALLHLFSFLNCYIGEALHRALKPERLRALDVLRGSAVGLVHWAGLFVWGLVFAQALRRYVEFNSGDLYVLGFFACLFPLITAFTARAAMAGERRKREWGFPLAE